MAQAAGGARTTRSGRLPGRVNGHGYAAPPVPLYAVSEAHRAVPTVPQWARLPRLLGRAGVWTVPAYAIAILVAFGRTGTPVAVAWILTPLSLLAVAGLLAGGPGGRLAMGGAASGSAGGLVLVVASGSPVGQHPQRPLALAGAALLAAGWLLLGVAVLYARAHRIGDGLLLVLCAAPLALGGFVVDGAPRLAALLLLAAGIGLCCSALDPAGSP